MKSIIVIGSLLFLFSMKMYSQLKITGPECIVPGTEYQYDIFGKTDLQTDLEVCVEGGRIVSSNSTCGKVAGVNYFRIIWNDDISKGKISITSSTGKGSFNVRPTKVLQGGKIDTLSRIQRVSSAGLSRTINCSSSRGGSCSPSFVYQWEQSDDNLRWTEVKGAVSQNISFSPASDRAFFLRRKTVETVSNTIAYSDIAVIVVNSQPGTN